MDGIGNALGQMFGCLIAIIVILAIGFIGTGCYYFFKDDAIKIIDTKIESLRIAIYLSVDLMKRYGFV